MDPTDDDTADGMSGVPIAESDAVPSVVPAAHQTLCTEGTAENDIGLVPVTIPESEAYGVQIVKENEVPIGQRPAHGVASQHSSGESSTLSTSAKPKPPRPPPPSMESLTHRTAHTDHVHVPVEERGSYQESNTLGPPPKNSPSMAPPMAPPSYTEAMSYPLQATEQQSHQPQPDILTSSVSVLYPYPQASSASPHARYSYPQAVGTPESQYSLADRPPVPHQTTFPPPAGSCPPPYQPQQEAVHAPIQRQESAPVVQMAAGPSSPIGYNVLDLLQGGNLIRLTPRNSSQNRPIEMYGSAVRPGGSYTQPDSVLQVVCPSPGVTVLRSTSRPYRYIGVTNHKGCIKGNIKDIEDQACHFCVHVRHDIYVCFESMKFPGVFFNLSKKKFTGVEDWDAQFRVRAEVILNSPSTPLMTPYGRPSVANNLPDRSIIQLYSKSTQSYLCISKSGVVEESVDEMFTYLLYHDRGMGIVSLDAYQRLGYRLRMFNNMLHGKGERGLSADFYFKDNSDGSVSFESVLCLGGFVFIPSETPQSKLSIYKILIQKHQGYATVLKIPIN